MGKFDYLPYVIVFRLPNKPKQCIKLYVHKSLDAIAALIDHMQKNYEDLHYLKINGTVIFQEENINEKHRGTTIRTPKWKIKDKELFHQGMIGKAPIKW